MNQFQEIVSKKNRVQFDLNYVIYKLTCGKLGGTKNSKLLEKVLELIQHDVDIFVILDKIAEVDKLKKVLFSERQNVLFNFFPRPQIKEKDDHFMPSRRMIDL